MTIEHPASHATEGDSVLADRLRAIPGVVRKVPAAPIAAQPAPAAPRADPFGRAAPGTSPFGTVVEVPSPVIRTASSGPIVRQFRVVQPKTQHRAMGVVMRRPSASV